MTKMRVLPAGMGKEFWLDEITFVKTVVMAGGGAGGRTTLPEASKLNPPAT